MSKILEAMQELLPLAWASDYARTLDNVFIQFNTSNSHGYGFTTKLIKVNPYTVNVTELIEAGLGSNNVFAHTVLDYSNYDVEISEDGEDVSPITVLSELYKFSNANREAMKQPHVMYLNNKSPDYIDTGVPTKFEAQLKYDGIMYSLDIQHIEHLSELPAKDYEIQIVPQDTPMQSYCEEAYEDDPGCGLYYYGWETL